MDRMRCMDGRRCMELRELDSSYHNILHGSRSPLHGSRMTVLLLCMDCSHLCTLHFAYHIAPGRTEQFCSSRSRDWLDVQAWFTSRPSRIAKPVCKLMLSFNTSESLAEVQRCA